MDNKIKLKYVNGDLMLSPSVAIVGSGGIMLNEEYGKEINKFDEVIRFNRSPVDGFEKHVGSKTTIRILNQHVFGCRKHNGRGLQPMADGSRGIWDNNGQPQYFMRDHIRNCSVVHLGPENHNNQFNKNKEFVHESCEAFKAQFNKINIQTLNHASVGISAIFMCIKSGIVPHVYGFHGVGGGKGQNSMSHYWENRDNITPAHNFSAERKKIQQWADIGKIILHLDLK